MPLRRRLAHALAGLALTLPALDATAAINLAPTVANRSLDPTVANRNLGPAVDPTRSIDATADLPLDPAAPTENTPSPPASAPIAAQAPTVQRPSSPATPTVQRPSAPLTRPVPSDTPPPAPPVPSDTPPPAPPVPSDTTAAPAPSDIQPPPPAPVPSDTPPLPPPTLAPAPPVEPVPSASPAPAPAPSAPTIESTTEPATEPTPAEAPTPRSDDPRRWRHGGFILDFQLGTGGCTRRYCASDTGHDAAPGLRLGGFVGGNILGIIEVGLAAGWNTYRPRDVVGQNALTLYGLDPAQVQAAIAEAMNVPALAVDLSSLTVQSASSRAFNIGPSLRVHFIRRGRGIAYVGADVHYQLWRNRYSTAGGDLRLDFHGVSAPLRAGGGVYVTRNLAIIGELSYVLTHFVVGGIRHPLLSAVAPLQALEGQASEVGSTGSLRRGLPHFWNLSLALRLRF